MPIPRRTKPARRPAGPMSPTSHLPRSASSSCDHARTAPPTTVKIGMSRPRRRLTPRCWATSAPPTKSNPRPTTRLRTGSLVGLGLLFGGGALVAQQRGVNLRLGLLIPILTVVGGAVLAWSQLDDAERGRWLVGDMGPAGRRAGLVRLGIGIALATFGVVVLVTQGRGFSGLWEVGIPAVAVLAGVALVAAPWGVRLWADLRAEQAQRIRETERADIAAH